VKTVKNRGFSGKGKREKRENPAKMEGESQPADVARGSRTTLELRTTAADDGRKHLSFSDRGMKYQTWWTRQSSEETPRGEPERPHLLDSGKRFTPFPFPPLGEATALRAPGRDTGPQPRPHI